MKCIFCDREEVLFRPGIYSCDCLSVGLYRKTEYIAPLPYKPKHKIVLSVIGCAVGVAIVFLALIFIPLFLMAK